MERSVDEVLMPALEEVRRRDGTASTRWAVAHRWANDWLARAQRLAPPAEPGDGVLIGDATGADRSFAGPLIRALELFCRRGGLGVLALPVEATSCLPDALASVDPVCVVVAGGRSSDEQIGRWAYSVSRVTGALPTGLFLRAPRTPTADSSARVLSRVPIEAYKEVLDLVAAGRCAKRAALADEANRFAQPG